ncbi:metal ABC transporter substrate-binding protein [Youxingia wuxianensis]|uniref:Zinc ABC transporter substrate-binding protein n=1 Tax=Youxingia wuxianensis TaxID=2763678 RepID=A0A926IHN2_9FIRM|nr:metal ABC transporter substrate-binding protein [Youxingia wuxianensis]MBC8585466.1 zinc ABC transporter substrate-binding protein [Youxingia wuxianensis]
MKNKIYSFLAVAAALLLLVPGATGCSQSEAPVSEDGRTLTVVTTLFPQYDFARQLAGEKGEVSLLLPPGVESHNFEPTPADIINIEKADLFIYTGEEMEPWAKSIIDGITGDVKIVDVSQNIALVKTQEEPLAQEEHAKEDQIHVHEYDPHFWTDPVLAKTMVSTIQEAFCEVDELNASYYKANGEAYQARLDQLNEKFQTIVSEGKRKKMIFGGKFPFYYFAARYGLAYDAAYDNCSGETEPSVRKVAQLIDEIRSEEIPVVYYEELTDPKVARSISEETGAEMLLFHSCHNVSKEQFNQGITYLDLMEQNAENLKKGLN